MPIIKRSEADIMRLLPLADIVVNPVNTRGAMGKGLAYEFRLRHPQMYQRYRLLCQEGKLKIGQIHTYHDASMPYTLVNLPTKDDWAAPSEIAYIAKGLLAFRNYLQSDPTMKLRSVAIPMLGTGLGNRNYDEVLPLFYDYLDDLPNPVYLSMRPDYFTSPLRYLVIFGPRVVNDAVFIEAKVDAALAGWGLQMADFEAIVSGACPKGVDNVAAGVKRGDDSIAARRHPRPPILIPADWQRHGQNYAGFLRNNHLVDIGTHFVGFHVDPASTTAKSPGSFDTIKKIKKWNEAHPEQQKELFTVQAEPSAPRPPEPRPAELRMVGT